MRWIMTKLRSQKGASLTLALLFFLLCVMVGASTLAAASSNAGKAKSRREEQQRYFAVSSALQMVAGRLENAAYTARTTVAEVAVAPSTVEEPPNLPAPSQEQLDRYNKYLDDLADPAKNYSYAIYKQESGSLDFGGVGTRWNSVLPLEDDLEYLFAQTFPESSSTGGQSEGDDWYVPGTGLPEPTDTGHLLTIKLADLADLALNEEVAGLKKNVYVTVHLGKSGNDKYRIFLTAKLKESDAADAKVLMALKTELIPQGNLPDMRMPGTKYTPATAPTKGTIGAGCFPAAIRGTDVTTKLNVESYKYKVQWKRGLIEKGAWQ